MKIYLKIHLLNSKVSYNLVPLLAMSEKQRISIVLIFLTLIILNSPCAKGGKDGLSSKATKIGLHQKFNNLEAELTDVRQLIHANFALTLDHEKMRAEIENLKERVLNLEMMNCALRTMSGEYEHHQALLNERRLTKSKSVPIEHSQQLIYNGNSKYNSEELGTMSDEVFMSETINGWDPNKCNGNLSIDSDHLVVLHKETSVSCCSVFAKSTIENHNFGFFYYEVTIVKECGPLFIGLANKRTMSVDGWVGYAPGSYAYSSGGHLFGHTVKDKIRPIDTTIPFVANDIIGCGVNLMTKQIIYTKNGVLLDTEKLYVNSIDLLYPCVTSLKPGNKIEANFGPNFEFNSILAMVESSSAINNENLQVTSGSATNDENLQVTTI